MDDNDCLTFEGVLQYLKTKKAGKLVSIAVELDLDGLIKRLDVHTMSLRGVWLQRALQAFQKDVARIKGLLRLHQDVAGSATLFNIFLEARHSVDDSVTKDALEAAAVGILFCLFDHPHVSVPVLAQSDWAVMEEAASSLQMMMSHEVDVCVGHWVAYPTALVRFSTFLLVDMRATGTISRRLFHRALYFFARAPTTCATGMCAAPVAPPCPGVLFFAQTLCGLLTTLTAAGIHVLSEPFLTCPSHFAVQCLLMHKCLRPQGPHDGVRHALLESLVRLFQCQVCVTQRHSVGTRDGACLTLLPAVMWVHKWRGHNPCLDVSWGTTCDTMLEWAPRDAKAAWAAELGTYWKEALREYFAFGTRAMVSPMDKFCTRLWFQSADSNVYAVFDDFWFWQFQDHCSCSVFEFIERFGTTSLPCRVAAAVQVALQHAVSVSDHHQLPVARTRPLRPLRHGTNEPVLWTRSFAVAVQQCLRWRCSRRLWVAVAVAVAAARH